MSLTSPSIWDTIFNQNDPISHSANQNQDTAEMAEEAPLTESPAPSTTFSSLLGDQSGTVDYTSCGIEMKLRVADVLENSHEICHTLPEELHRFEELRREGKDFDVIVKVGGISIDAHRELLSARIPYCKGRFANKYSSEGTLDLKNDLPHDMMENLIEYAYSGRLIITVDNVGELLQAARFLGMDTVMGECSEFLRTRMSISNAIVLRKNLRSIDLNQLEKRIARFIEANFVPISFSRDFLALPFEEIALLLKSDTLNIDCESQVFDALNRWIEHDEERREYGARLLQYVRIPLLPSSYLKETVERREWIKESGECIDLMNQFKSGVVSPLASVPRFSDDARKIFALLAQLKETPYRTVCIAIYDHVENTFTCRANVDHTWNIPVLFSGTFEELVVINRTIITQQQFESHLLICDPENNITNTRAIDIPDDEIRCFRSLESIGSKMLRVGGQNLLEQRPKYSDERFHVFTTCFSLETSNPNAKWVEMCSLKRSRTNAASCVYEGKMYVFGGRDSTYELCASGEVYDPNTDYWSRIPPMKIKREGALAVGYRGEIYVIGGGVDSTGRSSHCEKFNPKTGEWTSIGDLIHPRAEEYGVLAVSCGRLIVCEDPSLPAEYYNPEKDQWEELAICPLQVEEVFEGFRFISLPLPASIATPASALI